MSKESVNVKTIQSLFQVPTRRQFDRLGDRGRITGTTNQVAVPLDTPADQDMD